MYIKRSDISGALKNFHVIGNSMKVISSGIEEDPRLKRGRAIKNAISGGNHGVSPWFPGWDEAEKTHLQTASL